jgi:integrase
LLKFNAGGGRMPVAAEIAGKIGLGRRARPERPSADWVSKVISRVGKAAGVIVGPAAGDGKPNHESAHDLRRSYTERLEADGVPEREVSRVLRHASVETTRRRYAPEPVQELAGVIRSKLSTVPRYNALAEST